MGKYHKRIQVEGSDAFELAVNITGKGAPTEDTEAEPGMVYMDEESANGDLYKCIRRLQTDDKVTYLWKKMPSQEDVDSISKGIDVTAKVGQTIVVKEVDKNGKPTKWESVGYQPPIGYDPAEKALIVTTEYIPDDVGVVVSHSYDEIYEHIRNGGAVVLDDIDAGILPLSYIYARTAYFGKVVTVNTDDGERVVMMQAAIKEKSITYNTTTLPVSQTDLVGHAMISLMGASYDSLEVTSVTFPPDVTNEADQQRMLRAGAVKAAVAVSESEDEFEAGVLDCIDTDGIRFTFAGITVGKNRTAFVSVDNFADTNVYQAEVLAVHEGGGSSGGDAMRLKAMVEAPYEGTPPIGDMIDFTRRYTWEDIAEAYVAGRTITLNTEYDVVPFQYGMFWLESFGYMDGVGGFEFHGHYWRVKDVEADVDEGWVPAVAFLREDGTLTVENREWSGYAKQTEVDKLSKAIEDLKENGGGTAIPTQPYKTQELGQLYPARDNYTAWCPDCLHYDAALDRYVMLVYGKVSHTGAYKNAYQTTIDPYNYKADALTTIKFYDTDGVTDISPSSYGVLSWTILSTGEYYMIAEASDGATYSFASADYGKTWVKRAAITGFTGHPWNTTELSNGRILLSNDYGGNSGIYYSDNGVDFTNVQPETSGGDNETEICFLELTPGVVMAIARYNTGGIGSWNGGSGDSQHSLISYSQDYGTTWTPWKLSETLDNQNASSATGFVRNGKVEIFTGSRWYHYNASNVNNDYTNTGKDGAITHYSATVENALSDKFTNLGRVVYAKATEDNIAAQDFHTPCVAVKDDDNMLLVYFDRVTPYTEAKTNHYFVRGSRYGFSQQALNFSGAVTATYSGGKNVDVYIPEIDQTLTREGYPADASAVGDKLAQKINTPTSALVGQVLKVTEVDETGKPIAWEAADVNITVEGDGTALNHSALSGRDNAGQHPISAITGLAEELSKKSERVPKTMQYTLEAGATEFIIPAEDFDPELCYSLNVYLKTPSDCTQITVGITADLGTSTKATLTKVSAGRSAMMIFNGIPNLAGDRNTGFTVGLGYSNSTMTWHTAYEYGAVDKRVKGYFIKLDVGSFPEGAKITVSG